MDFWYLLLSQPWYFLYGVVFAYGLIVGSYLNVCICRIPKGMSTFHPPSHCPQSGKRLPWYDNIPVLSYILLRGRSRFTGESISLQYPLIEFGTAVLITVFFYLYQSFLPASTLLLSMYFLAVLIAIAGIDFHTCEVPYRVTLVPLAIILATAFLFPASQLLRPADIFEAEFFHGQLRLTAEGFSQLEGLGFPLWYYATAKVCLNLAIGTGLVFWFILISDALFQRESMGLGDATVIGLIAAVFGPLIAGIAFFGGALLGLLAALTPWHKRRQAEFLASREATTEQEQEHADTSVPIPFCPFMCVSAAIALCLVPLLG